MNTMPDPFVPTHPPLTPSPPAPTSTTDRPKRRSGGKKKPASGRTRKVGKKPELAAPYLAPTELMEPAPAPKKPRKARESKMERSVPETVKVSIKDYAEMRVTAFQREFVKLHKILAPLPAKVRPQILAELGKVFG